MKEDLGLEVLGEIMGWDDSIRAVEEFRWMKLISRIKYDDYNDFLAGVRFVESFSIWLQQFEKSDREIAYQFVKENLIYISSAEMSKLIDLFFPEVAHKALVKLVTKTINVPEYQIWCDKKAEQLYKIEKRKILYMALSEGARIDQLRRTYNDDIRNDQVVVATELNTQKWESLHKKLREAVGQDANFSSIYLIDDFTGSGTSLIRRDEENKLTGKIPRFLGDIINTGIEPDVTLHIHHYIGTEQAEKAITERLNEFKDDQEMGKYLQNVIITFGMKLDDSIKVSQATTEFYDLLEKYYDKSIDEPIKRHLEQSGQDSILLGYGKCALPLILHHNTPNNSIAILWNSSDGKDGHPMRPLFRRMQRHTGEV